MKTESVKIGNRTIEVVLFRNPMTHENWHEAEQAGLVYVTYLHHGPDYWDDQLVFSKPADENAVEAEFRSGW